VRVRGNIASGLWETSHMGSWIVQFLWWLYVVVKTPAIPVKHRRGAYAEVLTNTVLVNYSDDHLMSYKKGGLASLYYSYYGWVSFLKEWFGMTVRDIFRFDQFHAEVFDGVLVRRGPMFLQYQAIKNPLSHFPKQPRLLPYRETGPVLMRLAFGREPKEGRDLLDFALACLGLAYGTYAANVDVLEILRLFYDRTLKRSTSKTFLADCLAKASEQTLQKIRQQNVTDDELLCGFPAFERLVMKK